MSNRELIIKTLQHLREKDSKQQSYTNVSTTLWEDWKLDLKKKEELRSILFRNKFIRHHTDDLWLFQLTVEGLLVSENEINSNGLLRVNDVKLMRRLTYLGIIPIIYALFEIIRLLYYFKTWYCGCSCHY